MNDNVTPLVLIILDGWGYQEKTEYNAIATAKTPNWDKLWQDCPRTLLQASGHAVGVPEDQMGNSEVGHIHMGAGRQVPQDLVRIDQAINDGSFYENELLVQAVNKAVSHQKAVHIIGLLSPGGVHSHEKHLLAMIELAAQQGAKQVYLHGLLDGRDVPPRSALASIKKAEAKFNALHCGRLASICGRYYAMDRDKRWERTQQAYDMLTLGEAPYRAADGEQALQMAYDRDENDEFVKPTLIAEDGEQPAKVQEDDVVIFMNFRTDRARQLTQALTAQDFQGFRRTVWPKLAEYVTLTEYAKDIQATVAYLPLQVDDGLGEYIAKQGLTQLRIAETEKYAHVTFFFNGGREAQFANEERVLVPSPKVATYDLQPEMSAPELTEQLCERITSQKYDVIICNYANPDMVGHTGNFQATVKAIEVIDQCLGKVMDALDQVGGELIITADHGNAEKMFSLQTDQPHTAHTTYLVPFVYRGRPAKIVYDRGGLVDVAPTMLTLLKLAKPNVMTGQSLLKLIDAD